METHNPIIVSAVVWAGFGAIRAGSGDTSQDETAIAGLLKTVEKFIAAATVGLFPKFITRGIEANHPVIARTVCRAGFVATGGGIGSPAENVTAIGRLLDR